MPLHVQLPELSFHIPLNIRTVQSQRLSLPLYIVHLFLCEKIKKGYQHWENCIKCSQTKTLCGFLSCGVPSQCFISVEPQEYGQGNIELGEQEDDLMIKPYVPLKIGFIK